jgi:hypothetical protein
VPLCTQSSVRWCTPYPCSWHPACPTGSFLDQMLHSNVWRRLRQMLTALPCSFCDWLHRSWAMFFYVFLSQSHSSNTTRAANDVPWYIILHHDISEQLRCTMTHGSSSVFKISKMGVATSCPCGDIVGSLGGTFRRRKKAEPDETWSCPAWVQVLSIMSWLIPIPSMLLSNIVNE